MTLVQESILPKQPHRNVNLRNIDLKMNLLFVVVLVTATWKAQALYPTGKRARGPLRGLQSLGFGKFSPKSPLPPLLGSTGEGDNGNMFNGAGNTPPPPGGPGTGEEGMEPFDEDGRYTGRDGGFALGFFAKVRTLKSSFVFSLGTHLTITPLFPFPYLPFLAAIRGLQFRSR